MSEFRRSLHSLARQSRRANGYTESVVSCFVKNLFPGEHLGFKISTVPRTNPIGEQEREIAKRLREVRKSSRYSTVAFADNIGVSHVRYTSYEYGRVPLPYDVGAEICRRFTVSQRWLVTGLGRRHWYIPMPTHLTSRIAPKTPFSTGYIALLKPTAERYAKALDEWESFIAIKSIEDLPAGERATVAKKMLALKEGWKAQIDRIFERATFGEQGDLLGGIECALREFAENYPTIADAHELWGAEMMAAGASRTWQPKEHALDKLPLMENKKGVPLTLSKLLDRARALASPRGMKSKLAEDLGVSASRITEWLGGTFEPGGDATLRLLHWVEIHEGQTKTPGNVSTTAGSERTRSRNREKPKSGPPRKK